MTNPEPVTAKERLAALRLIRDDAPGLDELLSRMDERDLERLDGIVRDIIRPKRTELREQQRADEARREHERREALKPFADALDAQMTAVHAFHAAARVLVAASRTLLQLAPSRDVALAMPAAYNVLSRAADDVTRVARDDPPALAESLAAEHAKARALAGL